LPAIRKAHAAYGDALGSSAPGIVPTADEAKLRVPRDAFPNALRRHVQRSRLRSLFRFAASASVPVSRATAGLSWGCDSGA